MRHLLVSLFVVPIVAGCTGLTMGENDSHGNLGTSLSGGTIAVDPKTETSYVLLNQKKDAVRSQALHAVRAGSSTSQSVLDLTGRNDPRLMFTSAGVLVMSQLHDKEHFTLFDEKTFAVKQEADGDTWYWGTRLSASRRWVGVADNASTHYPINVIDSTSLEIRVLPHGGDWVEAMFGNVEERLFAISTDSTQHSGRILAWDMKALEKGSFETGPDGVWKGANIDVELENVTYDEFFSYTWVGVSPDDSQVVIPLIAWHEGEKGLPKDVDYELVVLDTAAGTTSIIPHAKGPVGFTPDGSTIVSYNEDGLVLIDARTLVAREEKVPIPKNQLSFFVTHAGNDVLVAQSLGGHSLVLVDVASGKQTKMTGTGLALGTDEFVSRTAEQELWVVQDEALFEVDLRKASIEPRSLDFTPGHIGILPKRDELVLGNEGASELHFLKPDTLEELRTVDFTKE